MRAILQHCSGGRETSFPVGSQIIREGETARRLYVLVDGQLEVVKDGTVVANVAEPGSRWRDVGSSRPAAYRDGADCLRYALVRI
jgi:CRP/FNR family transcriptional regulator, cyclic AMP receptor protein